MRNFIFNSSILYFSSEGYGLAVSDTGDFLDAAFMAPALETRAEKNTHHGLGENFRYETRGQGNDIGVIVLPGQYGDFFGPAYSATDALVFVGRNSHTISTAANQHALVSTSAFHRLCHRVGEVRVIDGIVGMGAVVLHHVPLFLQHFHQAVFVRKAGVIAANSDFHILQLKDEKFWVAKILLWLKAVFAHFCLFPNKVFKRVNVLLTPLVYSI